jgi:hypothetical protein
MINNDNAHTIYYTQNQNQRHKNTLSLNTDVHNCTVYRIKTRYIRIAIIKYEHSERTKRSLKLKTKRHSTPARIKSCPHSLSISFSACCLSVSQQCESSRFRLNQSSSINQPVSHSVNQLVSVGIPKMSILEREW